MAFNVSYLLELKNRYSSQANKIASDTKKLTKNFDGIQRKLKNVGGRLDSIGSKMTTRITAPITAVGVASAISFGNFEEGLSSVLTLLDGTQAATFANDLNKVARNAIRAGFTTEDATKALFDSVSALGAGSEALETFVEAQKLAIGGSASLSISVDGITSLVNAYGKETTKASDVATAFFAAQRGGKTDVALLASNVGKVAPSAKAAGVGFKTLLATMAQLTLGGLSTEMATTGLRGAINALVKPSDDAKKVLNALGIASNATELRSQGLVNTLAKLADIAKKNPNLLARMIPEVEARTAVSALGTKEIGNLRKILQGINEDIKNGTGLTDAFAKKNNIFNQSMRRLRGSMTSIGIVFGNILAPAITSVGKLIGTAATNFEQFAANNPKLAKLAVIIAGLLAVMGPLAVAVGAIAISFAAISAPVLITLGAIAAITLAIATLIVFWDDLKQAMQNIVDFWTSDLSTIMGGISEALSGVGSFFGFGDTEINKNVNIAAQSAAGKGRIDGKIVVEAPNGGLKRVESTTSGNAIGNLGLNTAAAL